MKDEARKVATPGHTLLLRANNIGEGLSFEDVYYVPHRFVSDEQLLRNGDVVIAMSSGSKSIVGKAALATSVPRSSFGAFCGVVRPTQLIDCRYFGYYFQTKSYRQGISQVSKGTGINNLKAEHILDRSLPIPPKAEQERIASKIDELFSSIDEGERALERVRKLVERYRQSVLKAAVTGELTREWREQHAGELESGEALLTRILEGRRQAWEQSELAKMKAKGIRPSSNDWKKKYKAPELRDTRVVSEMPVGWVWASVEQLCFVETGATPKRGTSKFYSNGTIDWITSSAVNESMILAAEEKITAVAVAETNAKVFPTGSLIVAMYGEGKTRGKIAELGIPAATNQACAALLCAHLDATVKDYLLVFFRKNYEALRLQAAGGVQHNLNLSILKDTLVPIPPRAEMVQIMDVLEVRMSEADAVLSLQSGWRRKHIALRQTILREAFRGQLVPQDPTDEPASILLERIAAERAAAPKRVSTKNTRTKKTKVKAKA